MPHATYLVFGDLHGRVLPAFALARAWQREHDEPLSALLQVGDLGYFPWLDRLDSATRKHASRDPLELGVQQIIRPDPIADRLFSDPDAPYSMWFIAGNHEDYEALNARYGTLGSTDWDFPVDAYGRVRCLVNGEAMTLPGGLRVGGLWGIDHEAPGARRHILPEVRLDIRKARHLAMRSFNVLLTHDAPRDAFFLDSGSTAINLVIEMARPAFAFFGHYHGEGRLEECEFGATQVRHLAGLEFRSKGRTAEDGCVGVLRWENGSGTFEYVEPKWLRSISVKNWESR